MKVVFSIFFFFGGGVFRDKSKAIKSLSCKSSFYIRLLLTMTSKRGKRLSLTSTYACIHQDPPQQRLDVIVGSSHDDRQFASAVHVLYVTACWGNIGRTCLQQVQLFCTGLWSMKRDISVPAMTQHQLKISGTRNSRRETVITADLQSENRTGKEDSADVNSTEKKKKNRPWKQDKYRLHQCLRVLQWNEWKAIS